ncbi:MAG: LptM family lipoprotein [Clostridia bacterium]
MKKMMALILALVMVFALAACGRQAAPVAGGWSPADGAGMTDDAQAAFDKAMEGLVGVKYVPVALLGTQLVSGTNYCILCEATVVYPGARPGYALVYIYQDLQGKADVTNIVKLDIGSIAESGEIKAVEGENEKLMGGWTVDRESSVELEGALIHLASQIVSGTNHCVLCEGNELVFVYENLKGKTEVTRRVAIDLGAFNQ